MNDRQRDKLTMYVLVKEFLLANTTITTKWAAFAALFTSFVDYIAEAFRIAGLQEDDKSGVTKSKSKLRKKLIDQMIDISVKCVGYATVAENFEFLLLIKFVKTDLEKMADTDLVKTAGTFHTNVMTKFALIADYDLKQADMDKLLSLSTDFQAIYTAPRGNKKTVAQLTSQLNKLFPLIDAVLVKIDAIINTAIKSSPDFVEEYNRKRVIIKTPKHTRALQIEVLNDATGEPLQNAKVTVKSKTGSADLVKNVKRSGKQGMINKDLLADGEYAYEVEYNGCVKETGSLFVNNGVTTKVVVRMKKSE
jgi:5-hydroxyisourate hydrolase-like protein (transthyretin family)